MKMPNRNAQWTSPPLIVPKKRPAKFRLTFDLCRVSAVTTMALPMPHIEAELIDLGGSTCFGSVHFPSCFWQLPTAPSAQNAHSLMMQSGVFSTSRTLQGARNSAITFRAKVEPCFAEMHDRLSAWLDDFLLHSKTEDELFPAGKRFSGFAVSTASKCRQNFRLVRQSFKMMREDFDRRWCQIPPEPAKWSDGRKTPQTAAELSSISIVYSGCLS